jgi:hypothetical protein
MTDEQRNALYDFLVADWPMFVAWMARERGWKTAQCEEFLSALIANVGMPTPPPAPAWAA